MQLGNEAPPNYMFKHSMRITVNALLLLYFFTPKVRRFFGLQDASSTKPLVEMAAMALAISAVFRALIWWLN